MIFMLKKRPFTDGRDRADGLLGRARSRSSCRAGTSRSPTRRSSRDGRASPSTSRRRKTRVDPVFDDRPFFFARQKPWGLPRQHARAFVMDPAPRRSLLLRLLFVAFGKPKRRARGALRRVDRLLREPRRRLHRRGAGAAAAPDAAARPPDLHALDPALHAARLRAASAAVASGRFRLGPVCLGGRGARASLYALALPRVVPALLPLPLARADRDRDPARGPARLPDGDAVPARPARDRAGALPAPPLLLGAERHLLAWSARWPRWWPP